MVVFDRPAQLITWNLSPVDNYRLLLYGDITAKETGAVRAKGPNTWFRSRTRLHPTAD